MTDYLTKTNELHKKVRDSHPLVHHITNFVTMYQCARITAFAGASPVMAFATDECGQVTEKSDALVINTGTLNDEVVAAIPISLDIANKTHIPVVLDPVGINLSTYRHDFLMSLLNTYKFSVIRCNSVELLNLYGKTIKGRGIDGALKDISGTGLDSLATVATALASTYDCVIACTGETDLVVNAHQCIRLTGGSPLLPKLVGTGCMINSLIGSLLPVSTNSMDAAIAGITMMCQAGEWAASQIDKDGYLGSFESLLMDYIASH